MFKTSCFYSLIAGFLFLFGFNWLYHGIVLADAYQATADLWRTPAEMKEFGYWCFGYQFLLVAIIGCLYNKSNCCSGGKSGVCFGLTIGALLALLSAQAYIFMPIPLSMVVAWMIGDVVTGVALGIIFAFFKSCCGTSCCSTKSACCSKSDESCSMTVVAAPAPVAKAAAKPAAKKKTSPKAKAKPKTKAKKKTTSKKKK